MFKWFLLADLIWLKRLLELVVRILLDVQQRRLRYWLHLQPIYQCHHRAIPIALINQIVASSVPWPRIYGNLYKNCSTNVAHFTYFTDVNIVQWVDAMARLFDVFCNGVWHQLVNDFFQVWSCNISCDDVTHFLTNGANLRMLSIECFSLRHGILGGETNAEHSK